MSHKHKKKNIKAHDSDSSMKHESEYHKHHNKHCYSSDNSDSDNSHKHNKCYESDSDCIKHHSKDCCSERINCKQVAVNGNLCIPEKKPDMERIIHVKTTPIITKVKVIEGKVIFSGHLLIFVEYVACVPGDTQPVHFASFKVPFGNFIDSKCHHNAKVDLKIEIEFQEFTAINKRTINKLVVIKVCVAKEKHCYDKNNHIVPASFTPPLTEEPLLCINDDNCFHENHGECAHVESHQSCYQSKEHTKEKYEIEHKYDYENDDGSYDKYNNLTKQHHIKNHNTHQHHPDQKHHKHHECTNLEECQYYQFYKEYNSNENQRYRNNNKFSEPPINKDKFSNRYNNHYNNRYNNKYNRAYDNTDFGNKNNNWNKRKQRYCVDCGERIEYKAKYCGNCGRYVG